MKNINIKQYQQQKQKERLFCRILLSKLIENLREID